MIKCTHFFCFLFFIFHGGLNHKSDYNKQVPKVEVQLAEIEILSDLVGKAESCRARCIEILKGPISLKVRQMVNIVNPHNLFLNFKYLYL